MSGTVALPGKSGSPLVVRDIAFQPDGRVLLTGYYQSILELALIRLQPNGALDPS
uniref:hypothetical protein n=1 Tax=Salmonella sp. SAL4433 TaxID=3159888 RepID=UPI00397A50CC